MDKDRGFFQYKSGDLVYIISPLSSQLHTALCKVSNKYVGPVTIYKIADPHNYLLMTLDGKYYIIIIIIIIIIITIITIITIIIIITGTTK